ncbi:hypothetical protein [Runella sp.]|jgi:hypothetical protein|uniref:hypothetical protein n=1 Tax=Runella sp. TaxID=1960881 RepID=UPI0026054B61|nr:hypothetical protein [Runella sp.]
MKISILVVMLLLNKNLLQTTGAQARVNVNIGVQPQWGFVYIISSLYSFLIWQKWE